MLSVQGVSRHYPRSPRPAVRSVSFAVDQASTLAIVGESGAGKSTLCRMLVGLERPDAGQIALDGQPVAVRPGRVSRLQMVFQDPFSALNPLRSVGWSIAEPLRGLSRAQRRAEAGRLLALVGIDAGRAGERPVTFSGGQLQRIALARALAARPRVLVCDEPTSSLDVSVQAQVLNLILRLQDEAGFACVLVTHDLGVVRVLADDVLILRGGEAVEHAAADDLFAGPTHEYTRSLLAAVNHPAAPGTAVPAGLPRPGGEPDDDHQALYGG
jgi:ABC-type glutathione transport system ATPase component